MTVKMTGRKYTFSELWQTSLITNTVKPNANNISQPILAMECSFEGHCFDLLFGCVENGVLENIPIIGLHEDLNLSIYGYDINEEWEWIDLSKFKYVQKYAYNKLLQLGEDYFEDDLKFNENPDDVEERISFTVLLEYQIIDGKKQMTVIQQDISDYKKKLIADWNSWEENTQ